MAITSILLAGFLLAACAAPSHRPNRAGTQNFNDGIPAAKCLLQPFAATDGSLTRTRLDAAVSAAFAAADSNHDGALDDAEVRRLNESRTASCDRSPIIDWSSTGRVGPDAFAARYVNAFLSADTGADGTLSRTEMDEAVRPRPMRGPPDEERRDRRPQ